VAAQGGASAEASAAGACASRGWTDDHQPMRKVVGYVRRRYSLMDWGQAPEESSPDEGQGRRELFRVIEAAISRARVAAPTMPASSPSCAVRMRASGRWPAPVTTAA
jgi:hypothetical protein